MMKNITPEAILAIMQERNLNFFDLSSSNLNAVLRPLRRNFPRFVVKYGCSKGAMVFTRKDADFVIKIPFTYDGWHRLYGANNSQNSWDYCLKEVEVYDAAERRGLGHFLAKTSLLGYVNGYPIYVQKRVQVTPHYYFWEDVRDIRSTPKTNLQAERLYFGRNAYRSGFSRDVVALMVVCFGYRPTQRFLKFAAELRLNDWHYGNFGLDFTTSDIVFCDYTGFYQ